MKWQWKRKKYFVHASSSENKYESVSKSFRTGRLEQELQTVQLSATRCSCIAILWVSLVSFAAITLCVASQRVFIVIAVYFVIELVRKLLDTPSDVSKLTSGFCSCTRFFQHLCKISQKFDAVWWVYLQSCRGWTSFLLQALLVGEILYTGHSK
jgi:hypothetical protein